MHFASDLNVDREPLDKLPGHSNAWIRDLAVLAAPGAASATHIASGGTDNKVFIWDMERGVSVNTLAGHASWVNTLSYDHRNNLLYTAGCDQRVGVWDMRMGRHVTFLMGHAGYVNSITFNESSIFSGSSDKSILQWDLGQRDVVRHMNAHESTVRSLRVRGDTLFSGGRDDTVRKWDVKTGKCIDVYEGGTKAYFTLRLVGDMLYAGNDDNCVRVFDTTGMNGRGRDACQIVYQFDGGVNAIEVCDNILVAGMSKNNANITIFDMHTHAVRGVLHGNTDNVFALRVVDVGGRRLCYSGGKHGVLFVHDISEVFEPLSLRHMAALRASMRRPSTDDFAALPRELQVDIGVASDPGVYANALRPIASPLAAPPRRRRGGARRMS